MRDATWRSGVLVVSVLMITALAASPALAKGPSARPTGLEKCWVVPNPVLNGQQYVVHGSGYQPNQLASIFVGSEKILMSVSDASGTFTAPDWAQFRQTGTYLVTVYYRSDARHRYPTTCTMEAANPQ